MEAQSTGLFIAIEGGEGAGKSALTRALGDRFTRDGFKTLTTREPGATDLGSKLRQVWLGTAQASDEIDGYESLFIFAADRHAHLRQVIRPGLAMGKLVITDRYVYSAKAYQASEGVESDIVDTVCDIATGGLVPHRTYWLDVTPQVGLARIAAASRSETASKYDLAKLDFHERDRAEFKRLHEQFPDIITRIDAEKSEEHVLSVIYADILTLARQRKLPR